MRILILTDLNYPCDHAFLEEIYTKRFPSREHNVSWIMRSQQLGNTTTTWNNSNVFTLLFVVD